MVGGTTHRGRFNQKSPGRPRHPVPKGPMGLAFSLAGLKGVKVLVFTINTLIFIHYLITRILIYITTFNEILG